MLRPLELGEIVDRSVSFWRTHFKALFKIYLGYGLVQYALVKGFEAVASARFPFVRSSVKMLEAFKAPEALAGQATWAAGSVLVFAVSSLVLTTFAQVSCSTFAVARLLEAPPARSGARLWSATVGSLVLSFFWVMAVMALLGLPGLGVAIAAGLSEPPNAVGIVLGIILVFGAILLSALLYVVRFATLPTVLAAEGQGTVEAFRRSGALSSGRVATGPFGWLKARLTVLITITGLIIFIALMLSSIPEALVQGIYSHALTDPTHVDIDAVPQALLVPAELLEVFAQSALTPLYTVMLAHFYIDVRVRREGLDLKINLEAAA